MITSQIIQTSIDELKAITKVDLGVYDLNGSEVASTMERDDITTDLITGFAASPADSQVIGVHHLLKIRDEGELLYVLVARGMTDDVYMVGKIAVSQIQNLVIAYKERFDRNNFFQNLLLDNLLLVDIYNRAKKLHVEVSCPRAVYLIETKDEKDGIVSEVLKSMFSPQAGDYVTAVDESSLILIKSVENTTTPETLHELAETAAAFWKEGAQWGIRQNNGNIFWKCSAAAAVLIPRRQNWCAVCRTAELPWELPPCTGIWSSWQKRAWFENTPWMASAVPAISIWMKRPAIAGSIFI